MEIDPILQLRLLLNSLWLGAASWSVYELTLVLRLLLLSFFGKLRLRGEHPHLCKLRLPFSKKEFFKCEKISKKSLLEAVLEFFGDFACMLLFGVGLILLCYGYNNGNFRGFALFGGILGGFCCRFLWKFTLRPHFEVTALAVKYFLCAIFVLFGYPIAKFFVFFVENTKKLLFLCSFTIENKYKKVYNKIRINILLSKAEKGFADKAFSASVCGRGKQKRK